MADPLFVWTRHWQDSCPSCVAADGQIHSMAEWQGVGLWPQSERLYCQKHCHCTLDAAPEGATASGNIFAIPFRLTPPGPAPTTPTMPAVPVGAEPEGGPPAPFMPVIPGAAPAVEPAVGFPATPTISGWPIPTELPGLPATPDVPEQPSDWPLLLPALFPPRRKRKKEPQP